MVEKFYAYYNGQRINAYEAIRKRNRSEITTSPVEEAELFDSPQIPDRYPVKPVSARNGKGLPYFAYYSGFAPVGTCLDTRDNKETLAHALFRDVFLRLIHFTIKDWNKRVFVLSDNVTVDLRIRNSEGNYYIVDVMFRLKKTDPYSYYYKWNGYLALEVVVTTRVTKNKVQDLSEKGIQICSLKVPGTVVDKLSTLGDVDAVSEAEYQKQVSLYRYLYESNKLEAYGKLLGQVKTKNVWKDKYQQMKLYEEQEADMLNRIKKAKIDLSYIEEKERSIQSDINKLEQKRQSIQTEIDDVQEMKATISTITSENEKKADEYDRLGKRNKSLAKTNEDLKKIIDYYENHPFKSMFIKPKINTMEESDKEGE
ncbi:hypothetical protein ABID30_003225 [Enterococcus rotai]|uniref:coiled-coil domain-containing protein n=1 Tax=Enterococcus rotai TaxID=118060 RepID=UPI003391B7D8